MYFCWMTNLQNCFITALHCYLISKNIVMKTPSLTRENSHGLKSVKEYHFTERKKKKKEKKAAC